MLDEVIMWQLDMVNIPSYSRDLLLEINLGNTKFANIITGIRRCGKSTLVQQLMQRCSDALLYLNFDTPNLFDFQIEDFRVLDEVIEEKKAKWLFFDEIQVVKGWEVYVKSKLEQGFRIVVAGSNSTMLSRELGTRLTGRHLDYALYPFSYTEYLGFTKQQTSAEAMEKYMSCGGFPEYVQSGDARILTDLISDILYRDILVRYNIKDESALKSLFVYLMGNIGNLTSANKLVNAIGVKSSATVAAYFSYLESSYLVRFVSKFSYSYKTQMLNPKKVYSIDLGLHKVSSPSFLQDRGRKLENEVYLELLRKGYELYYYSEKGHECDFVACKNNVPEMLLQVCERLDHENEKREVAGLLEAMNNLHVEQGVVVTFDQEDLMYVDGRKLKVMPVWKWLTV